MCLTIEDLLGYSSRKKKGEEGEIDRKKERKIERHDQSEREREIDGGPVGEEYK